MSTTLTRDPTGSPATVANPDGTRPLAADVASLRTLIVNVVMVGAPDAVDRGWTLVDAGLPGTAGRILAAAERRFGDARPAAIVLTHGHFDHVGALRTLAEDWDVPIFAHALEFPYLDGRSTYPPPDPTVGGGLMARMAPLYPRGPIDVSGRLRALPDDGTIPGMIGWRWIHTPGHTPGHVAVFRESDRLLIAGDAFVTTRQESLRYVMEQRPRVSGPPRYYTTDWQAAARSVRELALLEPETVVTGHGPRLRGEAMRGALRLLAGDFDTLARPDDGRYVRAPAESDAEGVRWIPPRVPDPVTLGAAAGAALLGGFLIGAAIRRRRQPRTTRSISSSVRSSSSGR